MTNANAISAARAATLRRAAVVSLRAAGAVEVQLRLAGMPDAAATNAAIELGLAAYAAQDVALAPAVVLSKKASDAQHLAYDVLIAAAAVEQALQACSAGAAS